MYLMDYHNHHSRCGHAGGSIEDCIAVAIEKGLAEIGIGDHFPVDAVWDDPKYEELLKVASMKTVEFPNYIAEIKALREKYRGRIEVKISTEVAFVTSGVHLEKQKQVLEPFMDDFDYLLCGIHEVKFDGLPAIPFFPPDPALFEEHGEERIHFEYVKKMKSMVGTGYFDIVTHLDNHRSLWRPGEPTYSDASWREFMELLDLIKEKGMAVEINTSGVPKGNDSQFPNDEMAKELIARDIPLVLSSDAHRPERVGDGFLEFIEKARPWGLTHLCSYSKREPRLIPID